MTKILDSALEIDPTADGRFFISSEHTAEDMERARIEWDKKFGGNVGSLALAMYRRGSLELGIRPLTDAARLYIEYQPIAELANRAIDKPH